MEEADGTVVIHFSSLEGGTELTAQHCKLRSKPYATIDAEILTPAQAAESIAEFIERNSISILNVAGPRESEAPSAAEYAREVMSRVMKDTRR